MHISDLPQKEQDEQEEGFFSISMIKHQF